MKMPKLFKALHNGTQKDACKECDYYIAANGTCQSKKCSTGNPYVTNFDRKHCKPYHRTDMIGARKTIDIDLAVNAQRRKEMINLTMFSTEKDLMKLTGLSHDELWDNDFDLDDWDVGFVSDVPLTVAMHNDDDEYDGGWEEPIEDACWLVVRMKSYCIGYTHIEFKGRHYYMVYNS